MPDSKITALTSISTSTDPANDPLVIVDVSDTSMAATGTTKKVTLNQLLGASGTATLASATITGDLTVDTNVLKVDTTNNRVGIGTASPTVDLEVGDGTGTRTLKISGATNVFDIGFGSLRGGSTYGDVRLWTDRFRIYNNAGTQIIKNISGTNGDETWYDGAGGTRMTLNSTGLGVGVTPTAGRGAVQLSAGIGFPATQVASSDANTLDDYEEGTWTPAIEGTTTAGSGTYSNQVGRYTKIGNQVTIWARLSWSAHTGTGNMVISGFPFTIANVNNLIPSGAIGYTANIAINAGNLLMIGGDPNSSKAFFWQTPTGGGSTSTVPLDTAGDVAFSMTYFV